MTTSKSNKNQIQEINWEMLSFQIITQSGVAKSLALQSLAESKKENWKKSDDLLKQAEGELNKACHEHMTVVTQEARGTNHPFKVLFMHAEDQLMTTQTLLLVIKELASILKKIKEKYG